MKHPTKLEGGGTGSEWRGAWPPHSCGTAWANLTGELKIHLTKEKNYITQAGQNSTKKTEVQL